MIHYDSVIVPLVYILSPAVKVYVTHYDCDYTSRVYPEPSSESVCDALWQCDCIASPYSISNSAASPNMQHHSTYDIIQPTTSLTYDICVISFEIHKKYLNVFGLSTSYGLVDIVFICGKGWELLNLFVFPPDCCVITHVLIFYVTFLFLSYYYIYITLPNLPSPRMMCYFSCFDFICHLFILLLLYYPFPFFSSLSLSLSSAPPPPPPLVSYPFFLFISFACVSVLRHYLLTSFL